MTCDTCGRVVFCQATVNETFQLGDRIVLVEGIPAEVCQNCGEPIISADTAEQVRQLVHGPHRAARIVMTEVLAYKAA
jgi:YgiT-type zinc finger domain-containing protein